MELKKGKQKKKWNTIFIKCSHVKVQVKKKEKKKVFGRKMKSQGIHGEIIFFLLLLPSAASSPLTLCHFPSTNKRNESVQPPYVSSALLLAKKGKERKKKICFPL